MSMMKMYQISLLIFLSLISVSMATAQTSDEEYLYANLGYKEQLLKGLDDKKGYRWEKITQYNYREKSKHPESSFLFEGLYRIGESNPCAIVVIYRDEAKLEKREGIFFCIPSPSSSEEVIRKARDWFVKEIKFNDSEKLAYIQALSKLAMYLTEQKER